MRGVYSRLLSAAPRGSFCGAGRLGCRVEQVRHERHVRPKDRDRVRPKRSRKVSLGALAFRSRPLDLQEKETWMREGNLEQALRLREKVERFRRDPVELSKRQPLPPPPEVDGERHLLAEAAENVRGGGADVLLGVAATAAGTAEKSSSTAPARPKGDDSAREEADTAAKAAGGKRARAAGVSPWRGHTGGHPRAGSEREPLQNPCWTEEVAAVRTTHRTDLFAELPVKHTRLDDRQWDELKRTVVDEYLLRLSPVAQLHGHVCSLPSLQTKIGVLTDHPLLETYMRYMTAEAGNSSPEPSVEVFAAAGIRDGAAMLERLGVPETERDDRFFTVRGSTVIFVGSYNTDALREAVTVGLADALRGRALLLRSAVMSRGNLRRKADKTRPSLVVGIGSGRGDYSGHNHVWSDQGVSHVWYGASWDPRRHQHRSPPTGDDLVEGANRRATRRIPLDTPRLLEHPENVCCCFEFGRESCNLYMIHRPEQLAYMFLLGGGAPDQDLAAQYDHCIAFYRLLKLTNCRFMSAAWGYKVQQVSKKVAEGFAIRGGKMGRPDRERAERFRQQYFPHVPCMNNAIVVKSSIPADAGPGWQPSNSAALAQPFQPAVGQGQASS
mmetsp:Transcript_11099/g.34034  ORF Transcript_11099/g.34034 Transcript_11099/m.34034 type:complete len:612 (+) Transcript_11099:153-1988(+)